MLTPARSATHLDSFAAVQLLPFGLLLLLAVLSPRAALAQALPTVVHANVLHGVLHVTPNISQEAVRAAFLKGVAAGGKQLAVLSPNDTIAPAGALFIDVFAYQAMAEAPVVVALARIRGKLVYLEYDSREVFLNREHVIALLAREAGERLSAKLDTAARPPMQLGLLTGQAPSKTPMVARFARMVPEGQTATADADALSPRLYSLDPAGFLSYFFQTTSLRKFNKHLKAGGPIIVFRVDPLGRSRLLEAKSPRAFREGDIDLLRRSVANWPLWSTHAGPVEGVYALGWGVPEREGPRP